MKKLLYLFIACLFVAGTAGQEKKKYELKEFAADSLGVQPSLLDSLPEISIVASKPLVKAEVDKTSYNVADDPDSKTNTLLEMLRKVPMVTVDGDDNVKVNGSGSFRIYMNGKPSNILSNNPKEVLRSIPAGTVKKIEVITDPGAKYDAEGVSGILNIVTKNSDFEGYNASVQALVMNQVRMFGGYGTMKYGKLSLSANYSFSDYRMKMETDYRRHQLNTPEESYLQVLSSTKDKTPGHFGGLEASYEIDTLNLIAVSASLNIARNEETSHSGYDMQDSGNHPVYAYNQTSDEREKWGSSSVKVDFQHLFKRNKEEMLTASWQYDYMPDDVTQYLDITDKKGDSPSLQYLNAFNQQVNQANGREHTLQLDYVNPFREKHRLEGGLKYIRRNNRSEALSEKRNLESESWQPADFQPEIEYEHIQNIMAAYAGYTFSFGNWSMNSGLRMEHSWQDVNYRQGNGTDFDYRATNWVPSLSALYKLSDRQQLRLAYNIRLRRPGIGYLNPYVLISGTSIRYGNPELVAEKNHRVNLSYSYFGSKLNVQATVLYSRGNGTISAYQFLDEEGVLNRTYANLSKFNAGALTLYMGYNPTPKTSVSLNAIFQYLDYHPVKKYEAYFPEGGNSGFSGSVFANFSQKLGAGWRFVLSSGVMRPEISIGRVPETYYFYSCYLGKTFLNDKLTIALRGQDFAESYHVSRSKESFADFESRQKTKKFGRTFGITFSYSFGNLKEKVRKAARSIENDDLTGKDK